MKVRAFITHKLSEKYSDCQDCFSINTDRRSVAVSDGMSESIFPFYWAEILSKYYADNGHCTDEDRKLLCEEWKARAFDYLESEKAAGRNPWRLHNCLAEMRGAGATICGVTFDKSNHWNGHVLGDSCIIEVNVQDADNPYVANIHTSEDKSFDCYPDYYDSFEQRAGRGNIIACEGSLTSGNMLLLVSDPFSEFLAKNKDKSAYWLKRIIALENHEEFCSLVDEWRKEGLHNDDSTLCIIEYDANGTMSIEYADDLNSLIAMSENAPSETLSETPSVAPADITESTADDNAKDVLIPEPTIDEILDIVLARIETKVNEHVMNSCHLMSNKKQGKRPVSHRHSKRQSKTERQVIRIIRDEYMSFFAEMQVEISIINNSLNYK